MVHRDPLTYFIPTANSESQAMTLHVTSCIDCDIRTGIVAVHVLPMCLKVSKFTALCTNTEFTQPRVRSVFVFMHRLLVVVTPKFTLLTLKIDQTYIHHQ